MRQLMRRMALRLAEDLDTAGKVQNAQRAARAPGGGYYSSTGMQQSAAEGRGAAPMPGPMGAPPGSTPQHLHHHVYGPPAYAAVPLQQPHMPYGQGYYPPPGAGYPSPPSDMPYSSQPYFQYQGMPPQQWPQHTQPPPSRSSGPHPSAPRPRSGSSPHGHH